MRRALQILAAVLFAGLLAVMALDLRHKPSNAPPKVISRVEGHGALLAGAAKAEIHVPYPVVPAGYGPKDRHEVTSAAQPQYARAIALQVGEAKLTLVSVDLLEIDSLMPEEIRARLPKDAGEVWICATHTHTGMGDYDPNPMAQVAGTGRFKKEAREAVIDAATSAITSATVADAGSDVMELSAGLHQFVTDRSHADDPPSGQAIHLAIKLPTRLVDLVNLGAHPTIVARNPGVLDSDFPGRLPDGDTAFFQGAGGNVSILGSALSVRPIMVSELVELREGSPNVDALGALAVGRGQMIQRVHISDLSVERAELDTPRTEAHVGPRWTRRGSSNLLASFAPRSAELSVARLGPLTLIAVPGEPTAAAGRALQQAVGDPNALIFGLCNGYVGYIETPDRVKKGIGEAPRQYFDATLLDRFVSAAKLASTQVRNPSVSPH